VKEIITFLMDVLLGTLDRLDSIITDSIADVFSRLNKHVRTFDASILLGGPHVWLVWTAGFADIPLDVAIDALSRIGSAPLQAFLDALRARVKVPGSWKTKVIRGDQAVFLCIEVITRGATDAGNLQFTPSFRLWQWADRFRSRVKTLIEGFRVTALLKKTVLKFWLFAVQLGFTIWNWSATAVAIVTTISLLDRLDRGLLDNYFLQQKNPLVKDTRLGRRRSRVA
jgi:hypothetical protein